MGNYMCSEIAEIFALFGGNASFDWFAPADVGIFGDIYHWWGYYGGAGYVDGYCFGG